MTPLTRCTLGACCRTGVYTADVTGCNVPFTDMPVARWNGGSGSAYTLALHVAYYRCRALFCLVDLYWFLAGWQVTWRWMVCCCGARV